MHVLDDMAEGDGIKTIRLGGQQLNRSQGDINTTLLGSSSSLGVGLDARHLPTGLSCINEKIAIAATNVQQLLTWVWLGQIAEPRVKLLALFWQKLDHPLAKAAGGITLCAIAMIQITTGHHAPQAVKNSLLGFLVDYMRVIITISSPNARRARTGIQVCTGALSTTMQDPLTWSYKKYVVN